jgi:Putative transposase DNA-binding domain/Probable transposase
MKQRPRRTGPYDPQRITKTVTHIRLEAANGGKLAALDELAQVFLSLCQQYVTLFCTKERPNKLRAPLFATPLSERWQRVAIQQAAGIAKSWRTNRAQAYQDYVDDLLAYHEQQAEGAPDAQTQEPTWNEWNIPELSRTCIQANANVAVLEPSQGSTFDYWLTISYDQVVPVHTEPSAPVVGVDVGIANFVTTSDGQHYGTFHGKLRERQKRDREKRRRKAKLRRCLEKKGMKKLPSTSSKSGQRLARHVRQSINRAVNQCFKEHQGYQFAYEHLSVATMKYKARAMNAYLYASNLAHIPKQIAWNAVKRGVAAIKVKSAYTSQECSVCHYVDRANRPDQQTFCCRVCGYRTHADLNAAINIEHRWGDEELRACKDRKAIKALLRRRHQEWKTQNGWP